MHFAFTIFKHIIQLFLNILYMYSSVTCLFLHILRLIHANVNHTTATCNTSLLYSMRFYEYTICPFFSWRTLQLFPFFHYKQYFQGLLSISTSYMHVFVCDLLPEEETLSEEVPHHICYHQIVFPKGLHSHIPTRNVQNSL